MAEQYDELIQGGATNPGLGIGAGAIKGALSVVLPYLDRHQQMKDAENLQAWKQTRKQILGRLDEIDRYEQLSERKGRGKVKLFDPINNPDHEAVMRFLTDRKPMTDKQYRSFMDIQTPLEDLLDDEEAQGDASAPEDVATEDTALSLGSGTGSTPPMKEEALPATSPVDPTAGNMFGDARASQPGGKLDTVTLPGGQLAEAPTTPGEVLVPPNGGQPVPGTDLLSQVRQNREARTGVFQGPAEGVPDREEGKTLMQRLHSRGWDVKLDKHFTLRGMSFKERTSGKADDVLSKYAQGVPWSEAIEGASAETLKLARPTAELILRADLAGRGLSPGQIEDAVSSEFGAMGKVELMRQKAKVDIGAAGPKAYNAAAGRGQAALDYPDTPEKRFAATARSQGLRPGTPEYDDFIARSTAKQAGTVAETTGDITARLKMQYGESAFANAVREFGMKLPLSPEDSAVLRATLERQAILNAESKQKAVGDVQNRQKEEFARFKADLDKQYSTDVVDRAANELGFQYPLTLAQSRALQMFLDKNEVKQKAAVAGATAGAREEAVLPYVMGREQRAEGRQIAREGRAATREEGINAREQLEEVAREQRGQEYQMDTERRRNEDTLVKEGRANAEFRKRAEFSAGVDVGKQATLREDVRKFKERQPIGIDRAKELFNPKTGENAPPGMSEKAVKFKRYIKLNQKEAEYFRLTKTLARDFQELRKEFNRVYKSNAPIVNWVKEKTGRAAGTLRRLDSFAATIGQFAAFGGESARRITDKDADRFKQALGLDSGYISTKEANAVFDRFERKLASSVHDLGISPHAIGLKNAKIVPKGMPERVLSVEEVK